MIHLMDRLHDPIDSCIATDSLMLRINEYDFEVFVGRVLVDPVRIQHSEIGATTANTFFSGRLERSLIFQLVDTLIRRFT